MKPIRFILISLAAIAVLPAQGNAGIGARLSYHWTDSFINNAGGSMTLEGLDLALEFPIGTIAGVTLNFEPSFFEASQLNVIATHTNQITRFLLTGKKELFHTGYVLAGIGYASAVDNSDSFNAQSGLVGEIGAGYYLSGFLRGYQPAIEVDYDVAGTGQLRGISIGLAVSF